MDDVAMLGRVVDETDRLVQGLRDDQLGEQTPCADWKVRDLLNHITGGATMFAESVEKGSVSDERLGEIVGGDNLGDDYKGAFHTASRRALDVFGEPGALEKMVRLPFGEMPAGVALRIAVFDLATHACDLARTTGQPVPDDDLIETALAVGREMVGPDLRQPGVFDEEQPVADDAPAADRLLAFAGRRI
jgi:uncharacterized protein (TIGR03086 family)